MRRICKYCGAEYDGDPGGSCCPACAAKQRETTLRPRTCRTCGRTFDGGPRAWYCPDCRAARKREATRRYHQRGPARELGSEDLCEICGKPYVVESGRQRYCKDCAEAAIRAVDNAQSRAWNAANTTPEQRRRERRAAAATIPCAVCGKGFVPRDGSRTCSPACAAELERRRNADWESAHREERNAYRRSISQAKTQAARDPQPPPEPPEAAEKTCRVCGAGFVPTFPTQLRCPTCRQKNHRKSIPLSEPYPCVRCGKPFVRAYNSQRNCPECQEAARREKGEGLKAPYPCIRCGRPFVRDKSTRRICPECREAARPAPVPWTTPVYCMRCGRQFVRTAPNQRFCPDCQGKTKKD